MGVAAAALRTNSLLVADSQPKLLLNAADIQTRTQLIEDIKENVMAWTRSNQTHADRTNRSKLESRDEVEQEALKKIRN